VKSGWIYVALKRQTGCVSEFRVVNSISCMGKAELSSTFACTKQLDTGNMQSIYIDSLHTEL
jgi:hypothetical protein